MGLISKTSKVKWVYHNRDWFESKGYTFTKYFDEFDVNVFDLRDGSESKVNVSCDHCGKLLESVSWVDFISKFKKNGGYYCLSCSMKLYGRERGRITNLKNGTSFEKWCIDNNKLEFLNSWDWELNTMSPSEINYKTKNKFHFKCSGHGITESKSIINITRNKKAYFGCTRCKSIAQWGIDNLGDDFLEKYWDYEKNDEIGVDPWVVSNSSKTIIWIKCQEREYHESYSITCYSFISGRRCGYCKKSPSKIHPLDSLGYLLENNNKLNLWSERNEVNSHSHAPSSKTIVWWKCQNGVHHDYQRCINSSNRFNFECPLCSSSNGEKEVAKVLDYFNISYQTQKTFDNLIGLGEGKLLYDFFIPQHNLLIEYQGEQHDRPIDFNGEGIEKAEQNFIKQQEHDKRKLEFAEQNNIDLLEIWYYDFNRINEILLNKLNLKLQGGNKLC